MEKVTVAKERGVSCLLTMHTVEDYKHQTKDPGKELLALAATVVYTGSSEPDTREFFSDRIKSQENDKCVRNEEMIRNFGREECIISRGYIKNVSVELQGFLEYIDTKRAKTDLTRKIDDQVQSAKKHEEWRREYMTLLMRDNENQKIGANRLRKLLQLLASKSLTDERERAINDSEYAEILYRKYNIQ